VELYAGLGGWSEAAIAEGYDCIGFDIEHHVYGEHRYPGQLVIQDVLTLHGAQFREAALIVASPPCQAYSYRAMPWKRAKALPPPDNALFDACFRIQGEACEAAGRHIPLIVENVRGAQPWVGRARWNFGSFYLWGDVPALMPPTFKLRRCAEGVYEDGVKAPGLNWSDQTKRGQDFTRLAGEHARKNAGGSWFAVSHNNVPHTRGDGVKLRDEVDGYERNHPESFGWKAPRTNSKSPARKAASALIAKIPYPLAAHIARTFKPIS
jgi:hypothetical protein